MRRDLARWPLALFGARSARRNARQLGPTEQPMAGGGSWRFLFGAGRGRGVGNRVCGGRDGGERKGEREKRAPFLRAGAGTIRVPEHVWSWRQMRMSWQAPHSLHPPPPHPAPAPPASCPDWNTWHVGGIWPMPAHSSCALSMPVGTLGTTTSSTTCGSSRQAGGGDELFRSAAANLIPIQEIRRSEHTGACVCGGRCVS